MSRVRTRVDDTPLDALSAQVRAFPPLDEARVAELLPRAHRDVKGAAAVELSEHHLDVALQAALQRRGDQLDVFDLYQEAALAVTIAVEEFVARDNPAAGGLRPYVVASVDRHLDAALELERARERELREFARDADLLSGAEMALRRRLGRAATAPEIGEMLSWTTERVELMTVMVHEAQDLTDSELLDYLDDETDDEERSGAG